MQSGWEYIFGRVCSEWTCLYVELNILIVGIIYAMLFMYESSHVCIYNMEIVICITGASKLFTWY